VKRLRILGYIVGGAIVLSAIAYVSVLLSLEWSMRPMSWDTSDSDFLTVAMPPLEACGPIPAALGVTHYYRHNNFNDGDELWRLEAGDTNAVSTLLTLLKMVSANSKDRVSRILGVIENKPDWVVRPHTETKWFFIESDPQTSDGSRGCMFGRLYLWSMDGKVFFLYHIIT